MNILTTTSSTTTTTTSSRHTFLLPTGLAAMVTHSQPALVQLVQQAEPDEQPDSTSGSRAV